MADITIIGGAMGGLLNGMLLAKDGHTVTVLERDPTPPPANPLDAWEWERRGVRQFSYGHWFHPRFMAELDRELPGVTDMLREINALELNIFDGIPDEFKGGSRESDSQYAMITGRRPVFEAVIARAADATDGLTVRRGAAVTSLIVEPGDPGHLAGVVLEDGEEIRSDLVVDSSGRQSAMPRLLGAAGQPAPVEEGEDSGFVYYGKTFRSEDGTLPAMLGGVLHIHDTVSILTLPADNGTWFVGIVASSDDKEMRAVMDDDVWTKVVTSYPLVAHWVEGEDVHEVKAMNGIIDRIRRYVVDDKPVVTGLAVVGDAWSCTNPSVGRGLSIAFLHAIALRDQLRAESLDDPLAWALSWDARTRRDMEPWYHDTIGPDRHRRNEIVAQINGETYEVDDDRWNFIKRTGAFPGDGDVFRAQVDIGLMVRSWDEVVEQEPDLVARVLAADEPEAPPMGPTRPELLELLHA